MSRWSGDVANKSARKLRGNWSQWNLSFTQQEGTIQPFAAATYPKMDILLQRTAKSYLIAGDKLASRASQWTICWAPPCATSVGPFTFTSTFTCVGSFRFCVALSHLYRALHCHMRPFNPRESPPSRRSWVREWSVPVLTLLRHSGLITFQLTH